MMHCGIILPSNIVLKDDFRSRGCSVPGDVLRAGRCVGLASLTLFAFGMSETLASFMLSLEQSLN